MKLQNDMSGVSLTAIAMLERLTTRWFDRPEMTYWLIGGLSGIRSAELGAALSRIAHAVHEARLVQEILGTDAVTALSRLRELPAPSRSCGCSTSSWTNTATGAPTRPNGSIRAGVTRRNSSSSYSPAICPRARTTSPRARRSSAGTGWRRSPGQTLTSARSAGGCSTPYYSGHTMPSGSVTTGRTRRSRRPTLLARSPSASANAGPDTAGWQP